MLKAESLQRFNLEISGQNGLQALWHFRRYGFVIFGDVLSSEQVDTIRADAKALERRTLDGKIPAERRDHLLVAGTDGATEPLHRLPYFTTYCHRTREIVDEAGFDEMARFLLQRDAWRLEDTMHGAIWQVKRGGKTRYSQIEWHLDFPEQHPLAPVVSMGLYLDDSKRRNGCLVVVPGSHRYPPSARREPEGLLVEVEAGDVVAHAHNLLHESGPATPGSSRATLYLYYCGGDYPGRGLPFASRAETEKIGTLFRP